MNVKVNTVPASNPPIPEDGGLVFVTDCFGSERAGLYRPGSDLVFYPNVFGVGFDYMSSVRHKARGARAGESLTISA